jgi:hypothetical protein
MAIPSEGSCCGPSIVYILNFGLHAHQGILCSPSQDIEYTIDVQ